MTFSKVGKVTSNDRGLARVMACITWYIPGSSRYVAFLPFGRFFLVK